MSDVQPPLVIDAPSDATWSDEADLVIVGLGGAGVVAAIQARDLGADVIAFDRFGGGGASAYSGGVIYSGGTKFQRQAGFSDSAANMFRYLSHEKSAVLQSTLKRFCEGSNSDLEWLVENGVPFSGDAYLEKTAYPPDDKFLYYSGNENVDSYKSFAAPAPRGHRAVGRGFTGHVFFSALKASAISKGVRIQPHEPVRRLVMLSDGSVTGVEVLVIPEEMREQHQRLYRRVAPLRSFASGRHENSIARCREFERRFLRTRLIRARRGVLLSTGGFVNNLRMVERHRPQLSAAVGSIIRIGSMGCDGSGIDLGKSVGGATDLMDRFFIGRAIAPPSGLMHGILVDRSGRRFINEDAYTGFIGDSISDSPVDGKASLILDSDGYKTALKQCLWPGRGLYLYTLPSLLNIFFGGTKRARSIAALSSRCGFNPRSLAAEIEENNRAADEKTSDNFGKSACNIRPIEKAPFYAINMDLNNPLQATLVFTLGGLKVSEESGAVLRDDGSAVPGLFAAGRTAIGLCSKGYLSGMSLSDLVFSGRRAAHSILSRADSRFTR